MFSVKFKPDDPNILVSGGWDNTVQIWDVRQEKSVQNFYGPHICGDAIDVRDNTILTGSWRPENQLEVLAALACLGVFIVDTSEMNNLSCPYLAKASGLLETDCLIWL